MNDDMFSKVGGSGTESRTFMGCFAGERFALPGREPLAETVRHFRRQAYLRDSLAAEVGWSAASVITGGRRAPLSRELYAVMPRFALIMFGSNDVESGVPERYGRALWSIARTLLDRGVIPVLSTAPPRADDPSLEPRLRRNNAVVRGLGRALRVPVVDLHGELVRLPGSGLAGDGVHTRGRVASGRSDACNFGEDGLRYGTNVRNLLNLLMLDRLRRSVLGSEPPPDAAPPPALAGDGSAAEPFDAGPRGFADLRESAGTTDVPACDGAAAARGHLYRIRVDRPEAFWARLVARQEAAVELRRLDPAGRCVARAPFELEATLPPGTHHLAVVATGAEAGPHLLVVGRAGD
jgi:hypothetical protein